MCHSDYDEAVFWNEERPTARKPRTCKECRRVIAAGEVYVSTVAKWDEPPKRWSMCLQCEAAKDALVKVCEGYIVSMVLEDYSEHARDYKGQPGWRSLVRVAALGERGWMWRGRRLEPADVQALAGEGWKAVAH